MLGEDAFALENTFWSASVIAVVKKILIEIADSALSEETLKGSGANSRRHFRIRAKNIGVCPEGHPGAGGKAWLFLDEIVVR
ncbi:MAG: hypothetical protein V1799_21785 [bacterium]